MLVLGTALALLAFWRARLLNVVLALVVVLTVYGAALGLVGHACAGDGPRQLAVADQIAQMITHLLFLAPPALLVRFARRR